MSEQTKENPLNAAMYTGKVKTRKRKQKSAANGSGLSDAQLDIVIASGPKHIGLKLRDLLECDLRHLVWLAMCRVTCKYVDKHLIPICNSMLEQMVDEFCSHRRRYDGTDAHPCMRIRDKIWWDTLCATECSLQTKCQMLVDERVAVLLAQTCHVHTEDANFYFKEHMMSHFEVFALQPDLVAAAKQLCLDRHICLLCRNPMLRSSWIKNPWPFVHYMCWKKVAKNYELSLYGSPDYGGYPLPCEFAPRATPQTKEEPK
jgi:hypothetical protein